MGIAAEPRCGLLDKVRPKESARMSRPGDVVVFDGALSRRLNLRCKRSNPARIERSFEKQNTVRMDLVDRNRCR